MLLIISLLVAILILIISIYFLYGRVMSSRDRILEVPHPNKNPQVDTNISHKKTKKQKKSHKTVTSESGGMKMPGEIVNISNEPPMDNIENVESIIEPTFNVSQETGNTDVENPSSNNETIEALRRKIDIYKTEIKILNSKLEEANEKIASCKEEAEGLSEEIKNIEAKLIIAESSKSKIEEQLKKAEKTNSDSLAKTIELERRLNQNNVENEDLKLKVNSLSQRLDNSEAELKSEHEKLKSEQEKSKSEQEKLKLLKKENDKIVKKNEEIKEKYKTDNLNHINMYQEYEKKIEKLTTDQRAVKYETVKLNSVLQDKEQSISQLNEQIKQLNIDLIASKEKNDSISSNLEKITREMTNQATEWDNENRRISVNLESLKSEICGKEGHFESKIQQLSDELKERELNLHNLEGENFDLKEEVNKLKIELSYKNEEIEKNESLSNLLQSKADEIESLNKSNLDLLTQIETLERNLSQKTEEFQLKLQECLEKDAHLKEIDIQNREFKREIDRLHCENSTNLENIKEKSNLMEEMIHLKSVSSNKDDELNMRLNNALEDLKEKSNDLRVLQDQKIDQLQQIETLERNLSQKTEEFQLKLQECLEKEARLNEIDIQNRDFKSEIDRLHCENSANFENIKAKSNLMEEISHLKRVSSNKDDELNMRLNNALEELKEKSSDLRVLQDQKIDQLQQIEHLKKEISSREFSVNEKAIELSNDIKEKQIVIDVLVNEKRNLEIKLEEVKKSSADKEIQLQNSKVTVEFEEATKQLEIKNTEIIKLENEKVQFMRDIDQMRYETKENDHYTKLQINDLQEILEKKIYELNMQNEAYLSIKDKYDALEQKLSDSVISNSLQTQFLENNFSVEDDIQEIRTKPDFQGNETSIFSNDSLTIEEMQSHINKLESELLVLQRKYYELKDTSIGFGDAHESSNQKIQNINICPTDIVSIPPIVSTIPIEIHTEKSQSHSHLLESIEKLNIEISEQRLKNQDLQNSFSESYSEKNRLKSDYNQLFKDHENVKAKYDKLAQEFKVLKSSSETNDNSETITLLEEQLKKCQDDNCQLKIQLDHYRETLEKTENCLQNIQASVDQEENNWKSCLKSSEQEQERLEEKIRELLNQIEDLRNQKHSDSSAMISMETPSIANGSLSSETKKKRKRKNKKKKNKNRVTQP